MIRMQAPPGTSFFNHQGHAIPLDADGVAMVDERHAADLRVHGFTEVTSEKPVSVGVPGSLREQLHADGKGEAADRLMRLFAEKLTTLSPQQIANMLAGAEADMRHDSQDALSEEPAAPMSPSSPVVEERGPEIADPIAGEGVPSLGKLTDSQIERMTKPQMIAWLKDRDVPTVPPIDADTLRAKVRHENAKG